MWSHAALLSNGFLMRESERERGAVLRSRVRYQQFCSGHGLSPCVYVRMCLRACVCTCEIVCTTFGACVFMCLRYLTDPLLHGEPSLSFMLLSGGRGNDTFVALNKQHGSSHAPSTGSSSGWVGDDAEVREKEGCERACVCWECVHAG